MKTTVRAFAAIAAALLMGAASARGQAPPDTIRRTGSLTVEELEQRLRVLERLLELERETAATRVQTTPVFTVASNGVTWRAADQSFQLKLRGYLHEDNRYYVGESHAGVSTLLLRRVRPVIEATAFKKYSFRIMPDFGGGQVVLYDAYVDLAFANAFQLRAGKFKPPVGLERLMSATALPFAERALPTSLVPNRDLGIQVSGSLLAGGLSYAGGVFNGVDDGALADADPNNDKEFAARVIVQAFTNSLGLLRGLSVGLAGTRGTQRGTLTAVGLPVYRSPGQNTFFSYRNNAQATGTTIANGTRQRIAPQGAYYLGAFSALGEYVISRQDVLLNTASAELEQRAWQATAGLVLTGEDASVSGVKPNAVFDPANKTWGALELVGRVHALDIDEAAFPTFADPARSASAAHAWAVGLNWYLNSNVKLVLDYEQTRFTGGAVNGADRTRENALFGRVQFAF
jgi:phosphate-selective porin OprO and OprP